MKYKMKCIVKSFKDGNIFKQQFKSGDIIYATLAQKEQLMQSGPHSWQVLGLTPDKKQEEFVCPDCGFEAKSAAGLTAHMRYCEGEE